MQPSIDAAWLMELTHIRRKIRWGEEPDNPLLISRWLAHENHEHTQQLSQEELRQGYENQFRLLLETLMDELVPSHWRCKTLTFPVSVNRWRLSAPWHK